jgi:hypothetical protein
MQSVVVRDLEGKVILFMKGHCVMGNVMRLHFKYRTQVSDYLMNTSLNSCHTVFYAYKELNET